MIASDAAPCASTQAANLQDNACDPPTVSRFRLGVAINQGDELSMGVRHGLSSVHILWCVRQWRNSDASENWWHAGTLYVIVGGIDAATDEFVTWMSERLTIDDEVTIRVLSSDVQVAAIA